MKSTIKMCLILVLMACGVGFGSLLSRLNNGVAQLEQNQLSLIKPNSVSLNSMKPLVWPNSKTVITFDNVAGDFAESFLGDFTATQLASTTTAHVPYIRSGTGSYKLTAAANSGAYAYLRLAFSTGIDLRYTNMKLRYYISPDAALYIKPAMLKLYVGNTSTAIGGGWTDNRPVALLPQAAGWNEYEFTTDSFSSATATVGTFDWANLVKDFVFVIALNSGIQTGGYVVWDSLEAWPQKSFRPQIAIVFHDGYESQFIEGIKYLEKYRLRSTLLAAPDVIGTDSGYATWTEISQAQDMGCLICPHYNKSVRGNIYEKGENFPDSYVENIIVTSKKALVDRGFVRGKDIWAFPGDHMRTNATTWLDVTGATYDNTAKTITKTGAFVNAATGMLVYVSGTNITTGAYTITSKTSDNVIVVASITATGNNTDTVVATSFANWKTSDLDIAKRYFSFFLFDNLHWTDVPEGQAINSSQNVFPSRLAFCTATTSNIDTLAAGMTSRLNRALASGGLGIFACHEIKSSGGTITPANWQALIDTIAGLANDGKIDVIDLSDLIGTPPNSGPKRLSKMANYTITPGQSGIIFDNSGDTDGMTYTLPAAIVGEEFTFVVVEAQSMVVSGAPAATDTSNTPGSVLKVKCCTTGTWTAETSGTWN